MDNYYERPTYVGEVLFLMANKIDPSICIPANDEDRKDFILAFFLHCNDKQIDEINQQIRQNDKEVILHFFHSSGEELSLRETEKFDFSTTWWAKRMAPTIDDRRKKLQAVVAVTFND